MFKQVSANIAAQKQAGLFEEGPEDFALVSQDKKGQDVAAEPAAEAEAEEWDWANDFNYPGSLHHY